MQQESGPGNYLKNRGYFFKHICLKSIVSYTFFVIMGARAGVAELVDAPDSKSGGGDTVWVRVPPSVPLSTL